MRKSEQKISVQSPNRYFSSSPPTPAEIAAGAARWERRGPLARLVRRR
jgi:hypothetical protein